MTVANNNLPSALIGNSALNQQSNSVMSPANVNTSNNIPGHSEASQIQISSTSASKLDSASTDADFQTIMKQQLTSGESVEVSQVVDNKEINLKLINLDLAQDISEQDSHWIQNLKSHFIQQKNQGAEVGLTEQSDQISAEALDDEISLQLDVPLQAESSLPIANEVNIEDQKVSLSVSGGEALPPSGQVVSAVMSQISEKQPASSLNNRATQKQSPGLTAAINAASSVKAGNFSMQGQSVDNSQPSILQGVEENISDEVDVEFNLEKSVLDKLAQKNATSQTPVSGFKEAFSAASPTAATSQVTAPATQNISASQLPPHLQTMSLSPQSTNTQWGEALNERVSFLVNHKLNSAEIRLDPPHLGKLDIQIQVKEDTATITIHTQHAQTRDLIDSASARLREFLQEAGYHSVDVDVSHQEQSAQQQLAEQEQGEGTGDSSSPQSKDGSQDSEMLAASMNMDDGRIDYFA